MTIDFTKPVNKQDRKQPAKKGALAFIIFLILLPICL